MTAIVTPALFIFLWSSGFIVAKYGVPHVDPTLFLVARFAGAAVLLAGFALIKGVPWPRDRIELRNTAIIGILMHGAYLGGVWAAIAHGMSSGITAMIVSLQPIATGLLAGPLLGETLNRRQWLGMALGLCGAIMVLSLKIGTPGGDWIAISLAILGLIGVTGGTLLQKRWAGATDIRVGNAVQYAASSIALMPFAFLGTPWVIPSWELAAVYFWSTVMMSLIAINLFYGLIRKGTASRVSSLMYLVPPTTAVMAWILFDEQLTLVSTAGILLAAVGVALVTKAKS
jgi:drug/metabolite transporter (DMT)-like permease